MKKVILNLVIQCSIMLAALTAVANPIRCEFVLDNPLVITSCYPKGQCPINIYKLARNFQEKSPEADLAGVEVLYIYSRWTDNVKYNFGQTKFESMTSRQGTKEIWNYHVVLRKDTYIYDFEYNDGGRAVPVKDYFKNMLASGWETRGTQSNYSETNRQFFSEDLDDPVPGPEAKQRLHVRVIPAKIYLEEYSMESPKLYAPQVKTYVYWVLGDPRFADQTLESYLKAEIDHQH